MKNIYRAIILHVFFLQLFSCDFLFNDDSTFSTLDSKINFKIIESYDSNTDIAVPEIYIDLVTKKEYPCFNYSIIADHKLEAKNIIINISGIKKPRACDTAFGPADKRIKIGKMSGIYELQINGDNFDDKYNLLIMDSLIILDGKETMNTKPLINFLWRYPKNSFAYICGTTLADTALCGYFIDTLESIIRLKEIHFSDFAKIPYPESSVGSHYNAPGRYFHYQNEDDFAKIKEVMRNFKQHHFLSKNGIFLRTISWINNRIYSHLL